MFTHIVTVTMFTHIATVTIFVSGVKLLMYIDTQNTATLLYNILVAHKL